ncbi:hypothetical protein Ancab_029565 [Ancistrocladus abbreviatus]
MIIFLSSVLQRERRVRYSQLPHHRTLPKSQPRQYRRHRLINRGIVTVRQLNSTAVVVVAAVVELFVAVERWLVGVRKQVRTVVVFVALAAGVERKEIVVGGSVAAAELVLARGSETVAVVVVVVVGEHKVAERFSGDLATLHHHVEID